jgi:PAS domain S-box-containing protein
VEFNAAAHDSLGYTREEFARLNLGDIQAQHSAELIRRNIETMRRLGSLTFETVHRRRDGELRNVRVNSRALALHGRRYLATVWADITERIRAEEALRRRNVLLATEQESSIDGILAVDEHGRVLSCNRRFGEMWGLPGEAAGSDDDSLLLGAVAEKVRDRERFLDRVRHLYEHRREEGRDEVQLTDGRTFDRYSAPMFGPEGEYYGRVWYFRDMTERKRAEAALRESEQKYHGIFDESVVAILVFNRARRVVDANQASVDLLGYSRAELLELDVTTLLVDAALVERGLDTLRAGGRLVNFEVSLRRKDGRELWVLANARLLHNSEDERAGVLATLNDITELKRAEEARTSLEGQLRQAQKLESIGQLAGGIAHDFNNLLTVINGYSDLAMSRLHPGDPLAQLLHEILGAGLRAAELTGQLLAFSRRQLVAPRAMDLHELMVGARAMLARLVGEDIEIAMERASGGGKILADPGGIHQVLMNLVANARDAMPAGGKVMLRCRQMVLNPHQAAEIPDARPGNQVVLEVADTGEGMSPEVQRKAFEPFFTTKAEGKGTGLGLSTVYGIVRQCGGWIQLESRPQQGTLFRIGFPALEEPAPGETPDKRAGAPLGGQETILVVEDQEEVRRFTLAALQSYHYRTLEARSGAEAIRIAEQHKGPLHLLLSDVIMPGMTGRQVAEAVATLRPETRVLFMSGYTADVLSRQGLDRSGGGCITKPFTAEELARAVRAALGEQPAVRVLVVDDDETVREYFASVLKEASFDVALASNGAEATRMMEANSFDVAVVDLLLPDAGGMELIRRLRAVRPGVRVVVASGAFGGTVPQNEAGIGADATLCKPVSPGQLVRTIRQILGG